MPDRPARPLRGLYAITPDEGDTARLLARVAPVIDAGAALLQYRNKRVDARRRREQALALQQLCAGRIPLIVNDDWTLAAEIGADGAHVGGSDGDLREARVALGPDAILGASCYDSLERAHDAVEAGADYIAFGAFFPSTTKPAARRADVALLHDSRSLGIPRVAIGGITPSNAPRLIDAGVELIAVIGGLFDAPDPRAAARAYIDLFRKPTP